MQRSAEIMYSRGGIHEILACLFVLSLLMSCWVTVLLRLGCNFPVSSRKYSLTADCLVPSLTIFSVPFSEWFLSLSVCIILYISYQLGLGTPWSIVLCIFTSRAFCNVLHPCKEFWWGLYYITTDLCTSMSISVLFRIVWKWNQLSYCTSTDG